MHSSSISWCPSISYRSTYSLTTLNLVFLLFFFHLVPQNYFMFMSSDILASWPPHSILLAVVVTVFGFLYVPCSPSLFRVLQPFWSFIGPYIFRSIFRSHVSRDDLICSRLPIGYRSLSNVERCQCLDRWPMGNTTCCWYRWGSDSVLPGLLAGWDGPFESRWLC